MKGGSGEGLPAEARDWEIATAFGWPKTVIDEQPAVWLDRMLELQRAAARVEHERAEKAQRNARGR